jgi:hypothetical protein
MNKVNRDVRVRTVTASGSTEWFEVVTVPGDEAIGSYWRSGRAWSAEHRPSGRTSRHSTPEDARDWVAAQW